MKKLIILSCILLIGVGCAPSRMQVMTPINKNLGAFSILEVEEFTSVVPEKLPEGVTNRLTEGVIEEVKNLNVFKEVRPAREGKEVGVSILTLKGRLIEYEKGSQFARWMVGYGAGKGSLTLECEFIDKQTGEVVYKANFIGEIVMGIAGGSIKTAEKSLVKKIAEFIKNNY